MGFFDIFSRKKEEEKVILGLDEIDSYIAKNINAGSTSINKKIEQYYAKIGKEIEGIKASLNSLAIAEIKDKVPDKARVRVLGNRDAYVRALQGFLQSIHLPDVADQEIALNFCTNLNANLNSFSETTKKNFYITEQLLGVELNHVVQGLRVISSIISTLRNELENENAIIVKNLRQRVSSLREKRSKDDEMDSKIKKLEQGLSPLINARTSIEEDIKNMKASKDYEILEKMAKEKSVYEKKMKDVEKEVIEMFSQLSKAIKKYNKMNKAILLDSYLESPFQALLQDNNLEILIHIRKIEQQLAAEELQMKGKTKEKMLKTALTLTPEYLNTLLSKYSELRSGFINLKSKIFSSRMAEEEMLYSSRLESVSSNIKLCDAEISHLKKIKEKLNIDDDTRIISNLLNKLTNKEFTIISS